MRSRWLPLVLALSLLAGCGVISDLVSSPDQKPEIDLKLSPLSGIPNGYNKPILVVKIDNISQARPHAGISAADLVYVEEIEGGYSRLAAVYSSTLPTSVGPVRSARITDISLLRQFGTPAFAYSGAQTKLRPILDAEDFIDISNRVTGDGWFRDEVARYSPHNLMINPTRLIELAQEKGSVSTALRGFKFTNNPMPNGQLISSVTVKFRVTETKIIWNQTSNGWNIFFDGDLETDSLTNKPVVASTVIVQKVLTVPSLYKDSTGSFTPEQQLIGSGKALLLRNGRSLEVDWSRSLANEITKYSYAGKEINLSPGSVWIVLLDQDREIQQN
jgi:hypothetical protein